jgi:hypothetical protein
MRNAIQMYRKATIPIVTLSHLKVIIIMVEINKRKSSMEIKTVITIIRSKRKRKNNQKIK